MDQNALMQTPPADMRHLPWRMSVAPMMAWTDRHCRHFHRLLTQRTRLYTEMISTDALIHGASQQERLRLD
ncbi:MAG: tRNA-dihydrouridine synthase, partial [Ottowia sp.]|nr:tRNA-dihydrouridine synthase [Ottowia sp.]